MTGPIAACRHATPSGLKVADDTDRSLLDATLDQLRLEGAIFFRGELTEGFAFESTPLALAPAR
jgi:hypothetical protein